MPFPRVPAPLHPCIACQFARGMTMTNATTHNRPHGSIFALLLSLTHIMGNARCYR